MYKVTSDPPLAPLELALQGNLLDCSFRRQIESRFPQWVSGQLCNPGKKRFGFDDSEENNLVRDMKRKLKGFGNSANNKLASPS